MKHTLSQEAMRYLVIDDKNIGEGGEKAGNVGNITSLVVSLQLTRGGDTHHDGTACYSTLADDH